MKSIYSRQFATMAGMILLSFLLLGASFAALSYNYTMREKKETLERNAADLAEYTSYAVSQAGGYVWDTTEFQRYLGAIAKITDAHVIIATDSGEILYGTDGSADLTFLNGKQLPDQLVNNTAGGTLEAMTTLGGLYGSPRYVVGLPVTHASGYLQGLVFFSADMSNVTAMWKDLSIIFLLAACAVILIAAIISSVTSMYQSRPMKEITAAARQFGHGELNVRVNVGDRKDEIGELAEAFNNMAESIAKSDRQRSEFIANVSHELKTPMTTIAGFADGILDGTIPAEKEKEYLQVISSETRRLSRLVRSMLELSRLQSDERLAQQQFDIGETLLRVLVSLESKVTAKRLEVDAQLSEEPIMVWGDSDSITQVCYNLLDNAIKFSPDGGTLGISVSVKGSKASVSVSNLSEDIPSEELPLIFDRFHKTDHSRSRDRDGVGLGLYIVKTILNTHKENITCTCENGVVCFTFTLTRA